MAFISALNSTRGLVVFPPVVDSNVLSSVYVFHPWPANEHGITVRTTVSDASAAYAACLKCKYPKFVHVFTLISTLIL